MRGEGTLFQPEGRGLERGMQRSDERRERDRHGGGGDPHHFIASHVLRRFDRQLVSLSFGVASGRKGGRGVRVTEEGEREVDVICRRDLAAGLLLYFGGPRGERLGGLARRPQREEEAHYFTRCFSVSSASAVSPCFCSSPAISSISRRPRFCESFQRVSMRVTGMRKLTMPPSMRSTYSRLSASNCGSHCGSMFETSLRMPACLAPRSSTMSGTPYRCTAV